MLLNTLLSRQHLDEFEKAGISAELFDKDGRGLFVGQAVEILDIHKLKDETGDKTVAVDAFEGNNLVLIYEGHQGVRAGENGPGCAFAMHFAKRASVRVFRDLRPGGQGQQGAHRPYAKSILFDYSYRYFTATASARTTRSSTSTTRRKQTISSLSGCLPACLFPAAAACTRTGVCVSAVQHRQAALDLRGRQGDRDPREEGRF